jgi:hypothetical protein
MPGVKPASFSLQASHQLATDLDMAHWFQGGVAEDSIASNDWTITDPGGDDISFVSPGTDDDPWIDRDSTSNADRLSRAVGFAIGGADFSVAFKVYVRSSPTFGTIQSLGGGTGAYTTSSGAGWKCLYFNGYQSTTVLSFNTAYDIVFTYTHSGTTGRWYINGVLDATISGGAALTSHDITAMLSDAFSERFDGRIALAYTWPGRVLTQDNVTSFHSDHYAVGNATTPSVGFVGTLATGTNKTTQTTVSATTGLAIAANQVVVVCVASDNEDTADGQTSLHSGVTIDGNAATKAGEYTNAQGAANAGATTSIWYWRNTTGSSIASASTIVATHNTGKDAKAITALLFDIDSSLTLATDGIATAADDAADPSSITATGAVNDLHLWVRSIALESDAAGVITPTANWTAAQGTGTTGGAETSNMANRIEWKVSTGTSSGASNPTVSAKDSASVLIGIALTAVVPGSGISNLTLLGVG